MPAVVSPGMKHFVVSSSRASVVSPKQEGIKFHTTSPSTPSLTPSFAPQNPKYGDDASLPAFCALASVPVADCGGGGAFKTVHTSGSGRPNSVPAYLSTPSPFLHSSSNVSPPLILPRNNCPTSPHSIREEDIKLKPGTPPLYVFPDGNEVSYLNENKMNHRTENCTLEETHQECSLPLGSRKYPKTAIEIVTDDSCTTSRPYGINTEVSSLVDGTNHSTRIDDISTHLSEIIGTSTCHLESDIQNSNITNISSHSSNRPARPTSLPLISLSSLVNNTSPASLSCNPASSPLVSAAYSNARSFSDIAFPQYPVGSDNSLSSVEAADPCVGLQVGGASFLTATSPLLRPLPNSLSTPPRQIMNFESESDKRDLHLQTSPVKFSSESLHVTEDKKLELHVTATEGSTSDMKCSSSCVENKDIMTDKTLTRSYFEDHGMNAQLLDGHQSQAEPSNFSHGIPLIEISNEPRKPSLDEEELRKFLDDIRESFQNAPSVIDTISVEDLKPPEYYHSVSRNSIDQELEASHAAVCPDHLAKTSGEISGGRADISHADVQDEDNLLSDRCDQKTPLEKPHAGISDTVNGDGSHHVDDERRKEVESCDALGVQAKSLMKDVSHGSHNAQSEEEGNDGEGRGHKDEELRPRLSFQNCMVFTRRCSLPTNESPSPPLSPPPISTNPPTPSTGPAAIYSAEVKVVMRSSQPPTPATDGESHLSPHNERCPQIHRVVLALLLHVGRIAAPGYTPRMDP